MKKLIIIVAIITFFALPVFAELTKETVVDKMEVLENGTIQVRQAELIFENGQVVSQKFSRYVVTPGQDVSDKDQKVQDKAASIWSEEVISEYKNPPEKVRPKGLSKETGISRVDYYDDGRVVTEISTKIYEDGKLINSNQQKVDGDPVSTAESKGLATSDMPGWMKA